MPRTITHELQLQDAKEPLIAFLAQTDGLAWKRGPILVQLPPSLSFDAARVIPFLDVLRTVYDGDVVCEPRHATWFAPLVASLLERYRISRVAADPPPVPAAIVPAGWTRLAYFRLHGSPRTYWSNYEASDLATLAASARGMPGAEDVWCIFDNTASGAAIENAWIAMRTDPPGPGSATYLTRVSVSGSFTPSMLNSIASPTCRPVPATVWPSIGPVVSANA